MPRGPFSGSRGRNSDGARSRSRFSSQGLAHVIPRPRPPSARDGLEPAASEYEDHYYHLAQMSRDAIFLIEGGIVTFVNDPGLKLLRAQNQDQVVGHAALALFPPRRHAIIRRHLEKLLKSPITLPAGEEMLLAMDGTEVPVEARSASYYVGERLVIQAVCQNTSRRRSIERQLREERDYANAVLASLPGVFYRFDENAQLRQWNRNFERVTGYSAEELLGMRSPDDFFFEKDIALVGSRVAEVFETGSSSVEADFRLKNGQGIPYLFTGVRFERDGKLGFVGLGIDISQRRAVEEALRRSEEHLLRERVLLRAVIDNIPDHIFFKDPNFVFLGCNPTFQNYYHRPESELIGKTDFDLLPTEWAARYRQLDEQIIATGKPMRSEETIPHEGGNLTFESIRVPFYDSNGGLLGLLGVGRDVTERKAMEEQLREKTALFEAQVESSLDGILVVDRTGKMLLQNRRWNALWKIEPGTAPPTSYYLERIKDPAEFTARVAWFDAHPEEIGRDELELIDGTVFDRYTAPVRDAEGRYYGRTWILRDITEERRREQRLRQAEQMEAIGNFAAGVAHDFNNVLTVIRFRAELLAEHTGAAEDNAPAILRATARGRDLVEQILHFATQRHMVREPMDLRPTVAEAVTLLRGAMPEGISITLELPDSQARVFGNATQLLRLVLNLGGNALQALSDQAAAGRPAAVTIRLETRTADERLARAHPPLRPGPALLLTVHDNGPGIDFATRERVFEPFFSTKGAGGTGLGLALVHSIVTQHDGNIAVDSTLGVGTSFKIWLPMLADAPAATSIAAPEERRRLHMLIVDDEPGIAEVTALILTELGHDAEAFESVGEARKRIAVGAAFDLVIVDRGTLVRDGAQSLEAARLCGPEVPVILMREAGEANGIVGAEAFGFLAKPFTPRQLGESCVEALQRGTA